MHAFLPQGMLNSLTFTPVNYMYLFLGSIDIEDYIEKQCVDPEDWDRNFRSSKARGQEIGRLPSGEEKIDCISISFVPVRSEVENLNRKYWDGLVNTLHR